MACSATPAPPTVGPTVTATCHPRVLGGFPVELRRIDGQTRKEPDTPLRDVSCTSTPACVSHSSCLSRTMSITNRIAWPSSQDVGRILRHQSIVPWFMPHTQQSVTSHCSSLLITTNLSEAVTLTIQRACESHRARYHASHDFFNQNMKATSPSISLIFPEFLHYILGTYCFARILHTVDVP